VIQKGVLERLRVFCGHARSSWKSSRLDGL
jgi:hypothetical protein